jgi:hypothetical protein
MTAETISKISASRTDKRPYLQQLDLKISNLKWARKKQAVSAVIAQKETPEVISITYL